MGDLVIQQAVGAALVVVPAVAAAVVLIIKEVRGQGPKPPA